MIILAIETSCDETAVSIVEFKNQKAKVLAEVVSSQIKLHAPYGGVVPMLAARAHLKNFMPVLRRAFRRVEKKEFLKGFNSEASELNSFKNLIDYIAVTQGPGLIPALTVGVNAAKALAYSLDKPLVVVNHLKGHIYANWIKRKLEKDGTPSVFKDTECLWKPEFPVLCLTVSGGHTQLILMKKDLDYKIIGGTRDDAAGEAFDKVAKLLELGYPGGPIIEKTARQGDKNKFKFPRPMMNSRDFDFSFSGLKTAVLYEVRGCRDEALSCLHSERYKADIAASFQQAVIDVLISKTIKAAKKYKVKNIILGGGVTANKELRKQFKKAVKKNIPAVGFCVPPLKLTGDNATMIAVAAYYHILNKKNIRDWKSVKANANLKL